MKENVRKEFVRSLVIVGFSTLATSFIFVSYIYFLMGKGLNMFQIGLLGSIYSWIILFLQIPTGALADVWGRKKTYILSLWILFASFLIYTISQTYPGFVMAEILWAVASSLYTGCVDAHIWESITKRGIEDGHCEEDIESFNKKFSSYSGVVTGVISAIGGFAGAQLSAIDPLWPWLGSLVCILISIAISNKWFTDDIVKKITIKEDLNKMLNAAKRAVILAINSKEMIGMFVLNFAIRLSLAPFFSFWEARSLSLNGNNVAILGYVWIFIELFASTGSFVAGRINKKVNETKMLNLSILAVLANAILFVLSNSFYSLIFALLAFELVTAVLNYAFVIKQQKEITVVDTKSGEKSSLRATFLSLISMSSQVGIASSLMIGGYISDKVSIQASWIYGSIMVVITCIVFMIVNRKLKVTEFASAKV